MSGKAYWFHVEHGMHTPGTSDEKSEVGLPFSIGPGQDFYFGISILMFTNSVSKWNLFFQLHSSMVLGSLVGLDTFPGLWHGVKQSALGVHYQSGDGTGLACNGGGVCPAHDENGQGIQYFEKFADNNLGTWNDIILHVKMSSILSNLSLKSDGKLEVWHRKAGDSWTSPAQPVVSKTNIVLGVTYTPKGMVADTYPRAGLYRDTWCVKLAGPATPPAPAVTCALDTTTGSEASRPALNYDLFQPDEDIYLDNIVVARTLGGAQSAFPTTDLGR